MVFSLYMAVLVLLIVSFLYGLSLNYLFGYASHFRDNLYKLLSMMTLGFGFFTLIIYVLGIIRLPIHYLTFLVASCLIPAYFILVKRESPGKHFNGSWRLSGKHIILIIILIVFLSFMLHGAFSYPWLEDDDPWVYAAGASYVKHSMTYRAHNIDAYYAGYLFPNSHCTLATFLGILNQMSPDLYSLMKTFISLALTLAVASFFLFSYVYSKGNELFSLISTTILVITPCFAGHFIFDYTLSVCIFLIFMQALAIALSDIKAIFLAAFILAAVIIAHPVTAIQSAVIMLIILVIYLVRDIASCMAWRSHKQAKVKASHISWRNLASIRIFLIGIMAVLFSMLFYGDLLYEAGFARLYARGGGAGGVLSWNYQTQSYDIEDKHLRDFFIAEKISKMDQQQGVGICLFSICLLGLVLFFLLKDKLDSQNLAYLSLFLFYFIFLWLLTGGNFHFSVQNYRWWSLFAIFIALHAAATIMIIISMLKHEPIILYVGLVLVAVCIINTSAVPRYVVQTSHWPPGMSWSSNEQLAGYVNLSRIGFGNRIFGVCEGSEKIIARNQESLPWDDSVNAYLAMIGNASIPKNSTLLESEIDTIIRKVGYQYIIIDSACIQLLGENNTNSIFNYYVSKYPVMKDYSNNGFILFQVRQ